MEKFLAWILELLKKILEKPKTVSAIPKLGDKGEDVKTLQTALNEKGFKLTVDGVFGPVTAKAISEFQKSFGSAGSGVLGPITLERLGIQIKKPDQPVNPAYIEAKKHLGKKETDPAFNKYLSGFWKIVGLPNYKTIVGASFAWCALFIAAMNSEVGIQYMSKYGAAARTWAKYGQAIDWKTNGIPEGAVIHINSKSCGAGSGNHVTFAGGSCTPEYLRTKGAVVPGMGGNQSNMVKVSYYSATKVCAVRWPAEIELPKRVTQNVNCGGGSDKGESTR
jgi:peptidoglycan hydrolase-like protein with peptidoglycan-binding domain